MLPLWSHENEAMYRPDRSDQSGLSLIELLVALAILALVITTSLALFFDRQKRLLIAAQSVQAWQAIANEAEYQKHRSFAEYRLDRQEEFSTLHPIDPNEETIVDSLKNVRDTVVARQAAPGVISVTMDLSWGDPSAPHHAQLTILRSGVRLW